MGPGFGDGIEKMVRPAIIAVITFIVILVGISFCIGFLIGSRC